MFLGFSLSSGLINLPAFAQPAFVDIDIGNGSICALRENNTVACNAPFNIPLRAISDLPSVQAISAGSATACALDTDGNLQCFGSGAFGIGNPPTQGAPYQALDVSNAHACAINIDNGLECWGIDTNSRLDAPEGQYSQLSLAFQQACALDLDGGVSCWGANDQGTVEVPADLPPAIKVVAGFASSCALLTDGSIQCWGRTFEPLNGGPYVDFDINATGSAESGSSTMCAIDTDGVIDCRTFDYNFDTIIESFDIDTPQGAGNSSISVSGFRSGCFINDIGNTQCFGFITSDLAPNFDDVGNSVPPTTGLRALVYSGTTIELFWDAPDDPFNVLGHEIIRNDGAIEFTSNLSSFLFDDLEPGVTETFAIRRVDRDGTVGEFSDPISVTSQAGEPVSPPDSNQYVRPERIFDETLFDAFVLCSDIASIFWNPVDIDGVIDGVELYRDGEFITFVEDNFFEDINIVDGIRHNYDIIAIDLQDPERFHGFATTTLDISEANADFCN